MKKLRTLPVPVTLQILNQKLDFEIKRLVAEKEEGIKDYVSRTAVLNGVSKIFFKKKDGTKLTLSYRLDASGMLRFAREKQFSNLT